MDRVGRRQCHARRIALMYDDATLRITVNLDIREKNIRYRRRPRGVAYLQSMPEYLDYVSDRDPLSINRPLNDYRPWKLWVDDSQ